VVASKGRLKLRVKGGVKKKVEGKKIRDIISYGKDRIWEAQKESCDLKGEDWRGFGGSGCVRLDN